VFNDGDSFEELSNVICLFNPCDIPLELTGIAEEKDAILTWSLPNNNYSLLGYNIYRDEIKINDALIVDNEYRDKDLENATYIYQLTAVYEALCEESNFTEGVAVLINLGISDVLNDGYKIYPNPTNGNVTIEGKGLTCIELYDIHGRLLAYYDNLKDILHLDVNNFANGLYFVKLYSETNMMVAKRLSVMK
jgi:hypothetical protein